MVATPLDPAVKYLNMGNFKFSWVPTIANIATPTRAELDAGTDLSGQIMSADGWSTDRDRVDAPDIGSGFTSQLAGRRTGAASSLTMYLSRSQTTGHTDVRSLLSQDDAGYIIRFDIGDVATGLMDVFPVYVNSLTKSTDPDAPATVQVNFSITDNPAEDVTVPAGA